MNYSISMFVNILKIRYPINYFFIQFFSISTDFIMCHRKISAKYLWKSIRVRLLVCLHPFPPGIKRKGGKMYKQYHMPILNNNGPLHTCIHVCCSYMQGINSI